MKDLICAVDKHRQRILQAERYIWQHPETGYKEKMTAAFMEEQMQSLGYTLTRAEGITGFTALLDTGRQGPTVMILGELDAVICPTHPDSNPQTGAVHACGHNAQCAALLGIAAALKEPGILDKFCGKILLCAVPAEEMLELDYRTKLIEQGVIRYMGGKSEFLSRGLFDGVDMAFMVHSSDTMSVLGGSVGLLGKRIIYKGTSAHAGGAPWAGHNALYAATCGINAVNAIRETFRDTDTIRFHPIITHGGEIVNAIPERVDIETYVRGHSFDAILSANKRINQALAGAALSLCTNVEIIDIPGYAPLVNDPGMIEVCRDAAEMLFPDRPFPVHADFSTGSTDMGDLSCIMPVVHPYSGGCKGKGHGNDFCVEDPEASCVDCAKWQLTMLLLLLGDGAARAKKILADFTPLFPSAKKYLEFMDSLNRDGDRIVYNGDGSASVRID